MKTLIAAAALVLVTATPSVAQVYSPLPIPGQPYAPAWNAPPPPPVAPYPSMPYAPPSTQRPLRTPTFEAPSYRRAYEPPSYPVPSYNPPVYRPAPVAPPTTIYRAPSGRTAICSSSVIGTTVYTSCF